MTYLQTVTETLALTAPFARLTAAAQQVYDGMPVLRRWATGALEQARAHNEITEQDLTDLRVALSAVITARLEADGLRAELESRGNNLASLSVFSLELETAISELETFDRDMALLIALPAFYKTGGLYGAAEVYTLKQGDTLEGVAERFIPGATNGAELIISATDGFDPNTELTAAAVGTQVHIPYGIVPPTDLLEHNWVLDSQIGLKALGQGLSNDFQLEAVVYGSTTLLTLSVISGVQNYAQCVHNRLLTTIGSIDGFSTFGCRAGGLVGVVAVPDVTGDWAAAEAEQAALSDPRTRSVAGVSVVKTGDAVSVDITLYPVNIDRDVKVTANFTLPGA